MPEEERRIGRVDPEEIKGERRSIMRREIVIVMVIMLLSWGSVGFAQDKGKVGLGVSVAKVNYSEDYYVLQGVAVDTKPDEAVMFGIGFTHFLSEIFSLEFGVSQVSTDVELSALGLSGDAGELQQVPLHITMRLHFYTKPRVRIHVGLGAGYYFNSFDTNHNVIEAIYGPGAEVKVEDGFAPHIGLTLEFLTSEHVALTMEVKHIWDQIKAEVNVPGYDVDLEANKVVIGVGCKYYF